MTRTIPHGPRATRVSSLSNHFEHMSAEFEKERAKERKLRYRSKRERAAAATPTTTLPLRTRHRSTSSVPRTYFHPWTAPDVGMRAYWILAANSKAREEVSQRYSVAENDGLWVNVQWDGQRVTESPPTQMVDSEMAAPYELDLNEEYIKLCSEILPEGSIGSQQHQQGTIDATVSVRYEAGGPQLSSTNEAEKVDVQNRNIV